MSVSSKLKKLRSISYNYPIQNQELFDKILPLSSIVHKETLGGIEYEFKIYDSKQLEYFFRYMTPKKYDNLSEYLLYKIADIAYGQGYHTLLYVDKTEKFYIIHE
jgi:hypothetical protein